MNRSRLEAFSDGVFAVAATLLVLDLTVEGPGHGRLLSQLGHLGPALAAYLISFFTIGIIWVNHHTLMNNVVFVTRPLLFSNLVLLVVVAAIPFATAIMADYLTARWPDANVAAVLYAGVFELMSISFLLVTEWVLRHDEFVRDPLPAAAKTPARLRWYFGQLPYLIAVAVGFISAPATVIITALTAFYYIFERMTPVPRIPPPQTPPEQVPTAE